MNFPRIIQFYTFSLVTEFSTKFVTCLFLIVSLIFSFVFMLYYCYYHDVLSSKLKTLKQLIERYLYSHKTNICVMMDYYITRAEFMTIFNIINLPVWSILLKIFQSLNVDEYLKCIIQFPKFNEC